VNFGIAHIILNTIGATVRWLYGTIWRTLFNKPKFTFEEYLYGPKDTEDYFDHTAHQFNNKLIAIITIGIIFGLLL